MLHCYRHIAPLEQDPQPIRVSDAINMELMMSALRCLLTPAAWYVYRNKMQRVPHSSGVLCKDTHFGHKCAFQWVRFPSPKLAGK